MVTMYEVAMNSAVLKTREGLQWLIGYNREALHDGDTQLANKCTVDVVLLELECDIRRMIGCQPEDCIAVFDYYEEHGTLPCF